MHLCSLNGHALFCFRPTDRHKVFEKERRKRSFISISMGTCCTCEGPMVAYPKGKLNHNTNGGQQEEASRQRQSNDTRYHKYHHHHHPDATTHEAENVLHVQPTQLTSMEIRNVLTVMTYNDDDSVRAAAATMPQRVGYTSLVLVGHTRSSVSSASGPASTLLDTSQLVMPPARGGGDSYDSWRANVAMSLFSSPTSNGITSSSSGAVVTAVSASGSHQRTTSCHYTTVDALSKEHESRDGAWVVCDDGERQWDLTVDESQDSAFEVC